MLCGPQFTFEDEFQVERAFTAFQKGAGDFADHLIGATNRAAGCERTVTFDRKAARLDGFEAL